MSKTPAASTPDPRDVAVASPLDSWRLSRRRALQAIAVSSGAGMLPRSAHAGAGPAFTLGVQYYRAPFPERRHWEDDLRGMKDAGLDAVQLWVLWSWVESRPGRFDFDDYDRLVELVDKHGLRLVVSAIAELHPPWIHREVPGSEMIDHLGHRVVSSNRSEANFGLTPGGCFDHPGVRARMAAFLRAVVSRYAGASQLIAWDIWNETRWNVQADGLVCFCPHTLAAYRAWLRERHGDLDGLNRAWKRRYARWDEVLPGRLPRRPYTEIMTWHRFITERANRHAAWRYELARAIDSRHPITLHGPSPCEHHQGNIAHPSYPLERGNDWAYADKLDGVGSSVFPTWWKVDDTGFAIITNHVRSAARGKRAWLSEVQGGRAAQGLEPQDPVTPAAQQRWVWSAIAGGIDTLLFWCWRDEVFGGESGGYGLIGRDGFAEGRLEALRRTRAVLSEHRELLAAYKPAPPQVGVLFSPTSFSLHWAQTGAGYPPRYAIEMYARAFTKLGLPWVTLEEDHLDAAAGLRFVVAPRATALSSATERALARFVRDGGVLLAESETGAFDELGFYREPGERMLARDLGVEEIGRRALTPSAITLDRGRWPGAETLTLPAAQWLTPARAAEATVWASTKDGAIVLERSVGRGRVVYVGSYLGDAHKETWSADFERFVAMLARRAGAHAPVVVRNAASSSAGDTLVRSGRSGDRPVTFVFGPVGQPSLSLQAPKGGFGSAPLELLSGKRLTTRDAGDMHTLDAPLNEWGIAVLA